jgi:hypothetical protein
MGAMNDSLLLVVGLLMFAGMIHVPVVVLLMRQARTIAEVSGARMREEDRSRRDLYNCLMRMLEKQGVSPALAMQQHSHERMEQARMETSLQREEVRQPIVPYIKPDGGGETDDMTLAME